jgi:c-di-GMP-binding flagellar brake protein YcgR
MDGETMEDVRETDFEDSFLIQTAATVRRNHEHEMADAMVALSFSSLQC